MKTKAQKMASSGFGDYLGIEFGQFAVKHRDGSIEYFPMLENQIGEVVL